MGRRWDIGGWSVVWHWRWRAWHFGRGKLLTQVELDHLSLNRDGSMTPGGWCSAYRPTIGCGPFTVLLAERGYGG